MSRRSIFSGAALCIEPVDPLVHSRLVMSCPNRKFRIGSPSARDAVQSNEVTCEHCKVAMVEAVLLRMDVLLVMHNAHPSCPESAQFDYVKGKEGHDFTENPAEINCPACLMLIGREGTPL